MTFARLMSVLALLVLLFIAPTTSAQTVPTARAPQSTSPFDDARFRRWADALNGGRVLEVRAAVSADLRSAHPHPLAPTVWRNTYRGDAALAEALHAADPALRAALEPSISAALVAGHGVWTEIAAAVPVDSIPARLDPFSLFNVAVAAWKAERPAVALRYLRVLMERFPSLFVGAWETYYVLSTSLAGDEVAWADYRALVAPSGALGATPVGRCLCRLLRFHGLGTLEQRAAVDAFLQEVPGDADGLQYLAIQLSALRRFDEAVDAYRAAHARSPFDQKRSELIGLLYRLDRTQEAEHELDVWAGTLTLPAAEAPRWRAEHEVAALYAAGERGRIRELLAGALARWPEHAPFQDWMAFVEVSGDRPAAALAYTERASALDAQNLSYSRRRLEALRRAGRIPQAWELFQQLERSGRSLPSDVYVEGVQILAAREDHAGRLALDERALQRFPDSLYWKRDRALALWLADQRRPALDALRSLLADQPDDSWGIDRLYEWTTTLENPEAAERALRALRTRVPWLRHAWEVSADHLTGEGLVSRKVAFWREASRANPGRVWPLDAAIALCGAEESCPDTPRLLDEARAAAQTGAADDQDLLVCDELWSLTQRARRGPVPAPEVERALQRLEQLHANGGDLGDFYRYRAELLLAINRGDEAAQAALAYGLLVPDSASIERLAIDHYRGLGSRRWTLISRMLRRDPYDGARLVHAWHQHVMWGGSPVMALALNQLIRERAPDRVQADGQAFRALGWRTEGYRLEYRNAHSVEASDRYVTWFDNARRNSLADATSEEPVVVSVTLDAVTSPLAPATASITWSNGAVVRRTDNPINGKLMRLQSGAVFVECHYSDDGLQLRRVASSKGDWVTFDYVAGTERVASISQSQGPRLDFEYGSDGRLHRIQAEGVGEERFSYGPSDRVNVEATPPERGVQAEIATAFRRAQDLRDAAEGWRLPQVTGEDQVADRLRSEWESRGDGAASLRLARHLVEHLADREQNASEAEELLTPLIERLCPPADGATTEGRVGDPESVLEGSSESLVESTLDGDDVDRARRRPLSAPVRQGRIAARPDPAQLQAVGLWSRLLRAIRPRGVDGATLARWQAVKSCVEAATGANREVRSELANHPVSLLPEANWLPRSEYINPGAWRLHGLVDILPRPLRSHRLQAVLKRRNGDLVVGTSAGLSVFNRGFWSWYGFDAAHARFSRDLEPLPELVRAASNISSLYEDPAGTLWLGTADGLFAIEGDYRATPRRWQAGPDELPSTGIVAIAGIGDDVLVGTSQGARRVSRGRMTSLGIDRPVRFMATSTAGGEGIPALVGTDEGVFAVSSQGASILARGAVRSAAWVPELGRVALLRNDVVSTVAWPSQGPDGEVLVPDQDNIVRQHSIFGLGLVAVGGVQALAVLTDQGATVFHQAHFEHVRVPDRLTDRFVGLRAVSMRADGGLFLGEDGVFSFEPGRFQTYPDRVFDLLTIDELRMTFVASERGLEVIRHDDPTRTPTLLDSIAARHLARDRRGRLIVDDGHIVLRYDTSTGAPVQLFDVIPRTSPAAVTQGFSGGGEITSLLVASDDTIWVTAGSSLFRYKDGRRWEFSFFLDADAFPSRTEMVSSVLETNDHRIWVVCSGEGHLNFNRAILEGGLLEWTGERFRRLERPVGQPWFFSSYTPVDDGIAIVGTNEGFARHDHTGIRSYTSLEDASYRALLERRTGPMPSLFLGTRGTRVADGIYLFGSAAGVVGWRDGVWFVPDRLNWMLPDPWLADYGGRVIHAVASDPDGHVYVGTDRGLLVYDSGGGDPASFLISSNVAGAEFDVLALQQQSRQEAQRETDALRRALPEESPIAQRLARLGAARATLREAELALAGPAAVGMGQAEASGTRVGAGSGASPAQSAGETNPEQQRVRAARQEQTRLLLQLEREDPALYQMVQLPPLELPRLRERLAQDEVIVQYLPTRTTLHIQVLTRAGLQLRQVDVSREELFERARHGAARMATHGDGGVRGLVVRTLLEASGTSLDDELAWLYDQLLRPIEGDLSGMRHIYVVPAGPLTYVPMGALLRSTAPTREYAAQRYVFGYLSSLYMFDPVTRTDSNEASSVVVLGDPDGSLPAARIEAQHVAQTAGAAGILRVGDTASYAKLFALSPRAETLHLATHGFLNHQQAERSYLLLAGGTRLSVADAMSLPLEGTKLVTLSACQSGVGGDGLEYATLARAFMHAGAHTVVSTLWSVEDNSAERLMESYYQRMRTGDDRLTALAQAQRAMITGESVQQRDPFFWAGYVVYGRP